MHRRGIPASLLLAGSAIAAAGAADAAETVTYSYDTLGRLVRVDRSGTVNSGVNAHYSYDAADNRTNVTVNLAGSPPPPPTGPNRPPTAVDDHGEGRRCQSRDFDVLANDSDPDGDAMSVTAVTGDPGFSILSATTIRYTNSSSVGLFSATYTVTDSRGASATAVLNVDVPRDHCQ